MRKFNIILTAFAFITIYLGCACFIKTPLFGIRINYTASLPYKFFFSTRFRAIEKYSYVSLRSSASQTTLVKQIVGIPGDQITHQEEHIFINAHNYGKVLKVNLLGSPLTPIEEGIIPAGYVFVHASHAESFDSRYQQFGLVQIARLQERLWPIF